MEIKIGKDVRIVGSSESYRDLCPFQTDYDECGIDGKTECPTRTWAEGWLDDTFSVPDSCPLRKESITVSLAL